MKTIKYLPILVLVVIAGCLPILSLNPLHTDQDVVFEEELVGKWINEQETLTLDFSVHPDDPNSYRLVFTDDDDYEGLFNANMLELEGKRFINFVVAEPAAGDDPNNLRWPYNTAFIIPGNSFAIVDSMDEKLTIRMTDNEKFAEFLEENPDAIDYQKRNGRVILTAQTEQLQQFALAQADTENLFPNELVLKRVEVPDPEEEQTDQPPDNGNNNDN